MPSEGVMILGALAAFFFCLALGSAGLKIYFARKVAEEEENATVSSTWSMSPGPSPAPAPAPAFAPAPAPDTTTSTYVAEPSWKFNPDGYEETD